MGTVAVLAVTLMLSLVQGQTLRDLARAGEPVNISIDCDCGQPPELREVVAKTDVVVRGTVIKAESHLTPDERAIETVYSLRPVQIVAQREPFLYETPGLVSAVRFVHLGGSVTIEGTPVTVTVGWLPRIAVRTEGLFFLKHGDEPDLFVLAASPHGAFEVEGGRITPMGRDEDLYEPYTGSGLAGFSAKLDVLRQEIWQDHER